MVRDVVNMNNTMKWRWFIALIKAEQISDNLFRKTSNANNTNEWDEGKISIRWNNKAWSTLDKSVLK